MTDLVLHWRSENETTWRVFPLVEWDGATFVRSQVSHLCSPVLPQVEPGQNLCARVIAIDAAGNQSIGEERCALVRDLGQQCSWPEEWADPPPSSERPIPRAPTSSGCSLMTFNRGEASLLVLILILVLRRSRKHALG